MIVDIVVRLIVFGLVVTLVAPRRADACSCAAPPPPCEAFWGADAVFTGEVIALASAPGAVTLATIKVGQVFRGAVGKQIVVRGGGMCGFAFTHGWSYFLYVSGDPKVGFTASLCGRSILLSEAKEDLAYATALPKRTNAVVEGTVELADGDRRVPHPKVRIVAKGVTTASATTDTNGHYRLELAPGNYTLDVDDPQLRVLVSRKPEIRLPNPAACATGDLTVTWNGRIRGTVTGADGKPVPKVEVSAHGVNAKWRLSATTDSAGSYEIGEVPAGKYVVAVNHTDEGGPSGRSPIATTFHPNAPTAAGAKTVVMTRAGLVERIDIKVPPPLATFTITGTVTRNGKPLAGQLVKFDVALTKDYGRSESATTDTAGRYSYRDVAGTKLKIVMCRPDAGPNNYKTACRELARTLDRDLVVDLTYPE